MLCKSKRSIRHYTISWPRFISEILQALPGGSHVFGYVLISVFCIPWIHDLLLVCHQSHKLSGIVTFCQMSTQITRCCHPRIDHFTPFCHHVKRFCYVLPHVITCCHIFGCCHTGQICHLGIDHVPPVCHQMSCSRLLLSPRPDLRVSCASYCAI